MEGGDVPAIRVKGEVHGKVTEGDLPADRVEGPAIRKQDATVLLHSGKNDFTVGCVPGADGDSRQQEGENEGSLHRD